MITNITIKMPYEYRIYASDYANQAALKAVYRNKGDIIEYFLMYTNILEYQTVDQIRAQLKLSVRGGTMFFGHFIHKAEV